MKISNKYILSALLGVCGVMSAYGFEVVFNGATHPVITEKPENSTGLNSLYIAYNTQDISDIEFRNIGDRADFQLSVYSSLGGGYAEGRPVRFEGSSAFLDKVEGDMGYIVKHSSETYYFWLIDYSNHIGTVTGLTASSEQYCDETKIDVAGGIPPIYYYSINGRQCEYDRGIKVTYQTLEWNEDESRFVTVERTETVKELSNILTIRPPLYCNTEIEVSDRKFESKWGIGESFESGLIQANGIDARTAAEQNNADSESSDNLIKGDETLLGGSAPADFTFYSYTTDGVLHHEWQIADDPEFEYIQYRFNETDLNYTFTEEGKYYVRFVGSNSDGSCEVIGDTYEIGIGASDLRIPNAFTPDGDGVNDEWKVGYRSLLSFKCWIFDRYGNEIFHYDRPDLGWDGRKGGKLVSPGVYYYVIEAVGADGKKYKRGGDINILKRKKFQTSSSETE